GNKELPGSTSIVVRGARGAEWGRLDVDVKQLRKVQVNFFLVSDKTGRTTSTTEDEVKALARFANSLFLGQINVKFEWVHVKKIRIEEDLGDPVDFDTAWVPPPGLLSIRGPRLEDGSAAAQKRWRALASNGTNFPTDFNVFCLWDVSHASQEFHEFGA